MIDTHCHLTYDGLTEQVDQVVGRARAAGVDRMITVGTTPADARGAVAIAEQFDGVFATVGVHPHYAADWPDRTAIESAVGELAAHPKVVALGEMGLDQHYDDPPIADQQRALQWQLEIAADLADLPIIIHNREATQPTLSMLRDAQIPGERFVFHCFTGTQDELDAILEFGAMVSFTGIVTFNSARSLAACAQSVPIDRLMIETDSPYLTPVPHRKVRPNEPCYVADVARFLADQRQMSLDDFVAQVDANAERFFGLTRH